MRSIGGGGTMVKQILNEPKEAFRPQDVFAPSLTPVLKDAAGKRLAKLGRPSKSKFGYLVGSDLNDQLVHDARQPIYNQGSTDFDLLRVTSKTDYARLHITKGYFRQSFRYNLSEHDCLLNLVTDADQHPRVLHNMVRLLEGYRGRVINHPALVLRSTREQVARRIDQGPSLRVPQVVRLGGSNPRLVGQTLAKAGFVFPALLRLAGTHGGHFVGLYDDADALAAALHPKQDYIVTEFVDYASEDGLYRKYRMFFIGEQRIFRHMLVADHWNIHANLGNHYMIDRPALLAEERQRFADPLAGLGQTAIAALDAVRGEMGLDFMGIDFGFTRDGKVLLFEANATMNFFPFFDDPRVSYRKSCLEGAERAFDALLGLRDASLRA